MFLAMSGVVAVVFALMRKKSPVMTPSSPRVNPTPQKTAGPTLGRTAAASGTPGDKMDMNSV